VPAFLLPAASHLLPLAAISILARFLRANRFPPTDQVRGHASLENATRESIPLMVFTRHWKLTPVLPMFRAYSLASDRFPATRLFSCVFPRPEMPTWMKF
jgi:hypothetical protein